MERNWQVEKREPLTNGNGDHHDPNRVEEAAEQYEQQRIEQASRQDKATGKSDYLGCMVYGGLDDIVTKFAVVSGVNRKSIAASASRRPNKL